MCPFQALYLIYKSYKLCKTTFLSTRVDFDSENFSIVMLTGEFWQRVMWARRLLDWGHEKTHWGDIW